MATSRGGPEVRRFIAQLPKQIETKVLRGAARVAANVVADEARRRLGGKRAKTASGAMVLIANAVKVVTRQVPGAIVAKVQLKGEGAYVGRWLEWGTAPHFITVQDSAREGRSVNRINRLAREGSLVIGTQFVGASVWHKGADASPFMRVSLDLRETEAIAAAQAYINSRVTRKGIIGDDEGDAS
ncbi:HK97 gp10 family phage protein [Sphingomonas mucosissima]|uniref:HK97 gp10 family phage protein n=1 Tax=Sphingomonas mucosissima TaxID=370959 RepID=A0A245ZRC4_9SPHN|nr:HK97 gp10 family phage protein [Sphingomonas mucosissima]OWK32294.1 hypothetical protein SPMU_06160 [Sphingomonas mucosissima]